MKHTTHVNSYYAATRNFTGEFPVLDVKLRNASPTAALLKRATFHVERYWKLYQDLVRHAMHEPLQLQYP